MKTVMTLTWYRHFQRNGGLNQILKRQTSRSHYGSKAPAVAITVSKYMNKTGKTAVKAVPYPAKQTSKTLLRHTLIRKYFGHFSGLLYLYTFFLCRIRCGSNSFENGVPGFCLPNFYPIYTRILLNCRTPP